MHLEGTPGQRLGAYAAEPGAPDHDAMLLLDMTTPQTFAHHMQKGSGRPPPSPTSFSSA